MPETSRQLPLCGTNCRACGHVTFPAQDFGCERCGAAGSALGAIDLAGAGRVLSAVTVYEHPDPDVSTPAAVGSVQLEEGPVVRARLAGPYPRGEQVIADPAEGKLTFHSAGAAR